MSAPLLDLLHSRGLHPRRVAATHGGEWAGPCPRCGGNDRFRVWPEQVGGPACEKAGVTGTWYCRQEQVGGDALEFLVALCGMPWAQACDELRIERTSLPGRLPAMPKAAKARSFEPKTHALPSDQWRERAAKLADEAHALLLRSPRVLAHLAGRGLPEEAVRRYRLGWLPGENGRMGIFRPRTAWGLQPKPAADGKPVKRTLFIPRGIIIPAYGPAGQSEPPVRIRIRRPDCDAQQWGDKYMLVEGGCGGMPMLLGDANRAVVVVEAELDAMLVHHVAGDLVSVLSVLTNVGKPDGRSHAVLRQAAAILVALDYDTPGANGWAWWRATYPAARRWPVPAGKDPGDAAREGEDLRAWILAGLPPVLTLPAAAPASPLPESGPVGACADGLPSSGGRGAEPRADAPEGPWANIPGDDVSALPPEVLAFHAAWQGLPVRFAKVGGGFEWQFPHSWAALNRDTLHSLLQQADATPALWDFLFAHPEAVVTPRNMLGGRHA